MKNQALFSSKGKSQKLKCRLLQFLFGALRVKVLNITTGITRYAIHFLCWVLVFNSSAVLAVIFVDLLMSKENLEQSKQLIKRFCLLQRQRARISLP